ncbi:hypothetical protein COO16_04370 [Bacillus pseudomycoides]|nr:hypothetical protein BLX05_23870 [Bacillus pseudomycoides]PDY14081.1 hypothetical protein COO16_04370 [Bacillus pseudomycoides]PFY11290.1 hypothetical protein COL42_25005 [Bacillus pseudomycoides]PGA70330.1 hypothetical protein COL89_17030 [Bacillus pseudomycoides]
MLVLPHAHQLKKNKGLKKEKMSRTLMNNCEKVKFLLWEISENLSLMGMGLNPQYFILIMTLFMK